ncbi:MAG: S9 family peptidase [Myxococcota bacterium]
MTAPDRPIPPVAERRAHAVDSPHGARDDEYYWLRDDTRQRPEVLDYLAAENQYTRAVLAPVSDLEEQLYQEITGRIAADDSTVPVLDNGYWYYTRFASGGEYPIYCRRKGEMSAPEEILLDGNQRAQGREFWRIAALAVSPDNRLLAYAEDTVGRREYVIRLVDLTTGEDVPGAVEGTSGAIAWMGDSRTLLYVRRHPTTLLPYQVLAHRLGESASAAVAEPDDALIYQEDDSTFYTSVRRSTSRRYIFIQLSSTLSDEVRYIDTADPTLTVRTVLARQPDHEYSVEHIGEHLIIRTNWQAENFRVIAAPRDRCDDRTTWRDVIAHRDDAFIHGFQVFRDFLAVSERVDGLRKIRIHPWAAPYTGRGPGRENSAGESAGAGAGESGGGGDFFIAADEPAYATYLGPNRELDSSVVRYVYTSLTTPMTTFDYDTRTGARTERKREPVVGSFDPADYVTEFVRAPAPAGFAEGSAAGDGRAMIEVPVSLVYHKDTPRDGTAPLYLYGYGSYGTSCDPVFSSARLSLLDRGVIYAIAHVRGGQELGRRWYEGGKLLRKKNTFGDFIAVTEHLVAAGYGAGDKVFAAGGSAGGLLVGAVVNMRPELYRGVIARVPFVDVVTTMLDRDLPLTTGEFDEWGDPRQREYYEYMLSYSPYDNVRARDYPAMLVTTGLWDSQVQYFEPAKWVARLRAMRTDDNPLLLHTNMAAGHGGKSGRYQRYREVALEYAFILHLLDR